MNSVEIESMAHDHMNKIEAKSRDHVSMIESLLQRRGGTEGGRAERSVSVAPRVLATHKMGASAVYRMFARFMKGKRAEYFDHLKRATYERNVVKAILKRVWTRRGKMMVLMAWYSWLNATRQRKVVEIEGKGRRLEKQLTSQIDNQYSDFVAKIETIQRENELIHARVAAKTAVDANNIMGQLREELSRVNEELGEVKMGKLEMERKLRRVEETQRNLSPEQVQVRTPDTSRWGRGGGGAGAVGGGGPAGAGGAGGGAIIRQRYAMYQSR
jgi:hypothetical protein